MKILIMTLFVFSMQANATIIHCDSNKVRTKCDSKDDCDRNCLSINAAYVGTFGGGSDGRQCTCHTGALIVNSGQSKGTKGLK